MDLTIHPYKLHGNIDIIPSKSQAHRLLILSAFAKNETTLLCSQTNQDMEATAACLRALGANIVNTPEGYHVTPVGQLPKEATLPCCESGSTLRFLLPVVGALGIKAKFLMEGRLPHRPLSPLWEEMERMGYRLSRPSESALLCEGKLHAGEYRIDGNISSQFITGLLLAASFMEGETKITIIGKLESSPYVEMTRQAMALFGIDTADMAVKGSTPFLSPGLIRVEGDWSNAAFWLAANALGSDIRICGLEIDSAQGDRAVANILPQLCNCVTIDASDIPDLVPILAVTAAAKQGAVFTGIQRLRIKESDRVQSTIALLKALGGHAEADENTMTVFPCNLQGGTVNACGDHRIAMAAAIAATVCKDSVTILGADAVKKSYPSFWEAYQHLGGNYELDLR
jgi:3-phosphoshikimate 1-carboxyvinyltransferase